MKNYGAVVKDARKQTEVAKAASLRHSSDLVHMKRVAEDARELLCRAKARQDKRDNTRLTDTA